MDKLKKRQASVLFDPSFYKKIEKASDKEGLTVAGWIRRLVISEITELSLRKKK